MDYNKYHSIKQNKTKMVLATIIRILLTPIWLILRIYVWVWDGEVSKWFFSFNNNKKMVSHPDHYQSKSGMINEAQEHANEVCHNYCH